MSQTKPRKANTKLQRAVADSKRKEQKKTANTLLRGIDTLIATAENADMAMATRIFYTAKEELVHWAVTMNFHESAQDRFINGRLYDNRLSKMESLIMRAISSGETRAEIIDLFGTRASK